MDMAATRTILLALLVGLANSPRALAETNTRKPCAGRGQGASILIDTRARNLRLCKDGAEVAKFLVAIGRAGTPKHKQGDNKTPLGTFSLGQPRPSKKHKIFIPVGYPTRAQKKKGFTGNLIGIHGPKREFAWAGPLNTFHDWTKGCIAVGKDEEIATIVAWVESHRARRVYIE